MVGVGGKVGVQVSVQVIVGVGESAEGVNGCPVREYVGVKVRVGGCVGARVEVGVGAKGVIMFPSARESEKAPKSKLMDARAMTIPSKTCRRFFISSSLQAAPPGPASGC